jgi:phospho-N-acetylmuramoyl-pentapeptide-transferase
MIYHLFDALSIFTNFQYITFRAAIASVTAFLIATLLGGYIIRWLREAQFRERTDKVHSKKLADLHASKNKTPSMGGLFMIGAMVISVLLFVDLTRAIVLIALGVTVAMWILGFVDDWVKLQSEEKHGIRPLVKLYFQCLIGLSGGVALYLYFGEYQPELTRLYVPMISETVAIGSIYPVLVMLVIVSTSNAVNLSDGLDGLAIGLAIMVALVYAVIAYVTGRQDFSSYLEIPMVMGAGEVAIMMIAFVGGGMGFLWYNCHPAQVFMGNTGSLPVGGLIGIVAVITKQELVLLITGGVFVVEALSVILQILSYKVRGKRIFNIAPIHHHFEFKGWDEPKIVVRFWIAATVFAILSLAFLKL